MSRLEAGEYELVESRDIVPSGAGTSAWTTAVEDGNLSANDGAGLHDNIGSGEPATDHHIEPFGSGSRSIRAGKSRTSFNSTTGPEEVRQALPPHFYRDRHGQSCDDIVLILRR